MENDKRKDGKLNGSEEENKNFGTWPRLFILNFVSVDPVLTQKQPNDFSHRR